MARIPDGELERLKRDTDLAALVRAHGVELKRRGKDLVGLCPFHDEKQGSFVVSPGKNLFHCLGCDAAGSVVDFVMLTRGVTFRQAVDHLRGELPQLAAGELPKGEGRSARPPLPSPLSPS